MSLPCSSFSYPSPSFAFTPLFLFLLLLTLSISPFRLRLLPFLLLPIFLLLPCLSASSSCSRSSSSSHFPAPLLVPYGNHARALGNKVNPGIHGNCENIILTFLRRDKTSPRRCVGLQMQPNFVLKSRGEEKTPGRSKKR